MSNTATRVKGPHEKKNQGLKFLPFNLLNVFSHSIICRFESDWTSKET